MAAGQGFKTFTTGEVLTAADVNGYLMQGVLVFASAAARNAAITSPQEGQFAFTKDTNGLWYYDGAAWVASGATGDIEGVTAGVGITGGGTSGTVTITNDMATTITAAGDLVVGTGSGTYDNLPIGTTAQVLTADTTVSPYKVKWATPSAGSPTFVGCELRKSANQTISDATDAIVTFDVETFDTDNFHSTSTNTGRITIPAGKGGKYRFSYTHRWFGNATGFRNTGIKINGVSGASYNTVLNLTSTRLVYNGSYVLDLAAGDYVEMVVYQNSGGNLDLLYEEDSQLNAGVRFGCQYLGA